MKKITIFLLLLFVMQMSAFADGLSCKTGMQDMLALFAPKTIVCNDNQFLPANSITCSNCPNGYICSGGLLVFDEKKSSGIDYTQKITISANNVCSNNFPKMLYANFRVAQRNCNPGYYLPANIDECRKCLNDHYCPGGQLTFNETTPQGIIECPSNHPFAPAGSSSCYAHILHVGNENIYLRSTKLTTPSLNVAYGNEVFYANMTTTPTYMTSGSTHYFKTIYNEQIYYICDDTTYGE